MPRNYQKKTEKYERRAIVQYSTKGELVKEWKSAGQIEKELNMDRSAILKCCKGQQRTSYWFIWKFKDEVEEELTEKLTEKIQA